MPDAVDRVVLGASLPKTNEQLARLVTAGRGSLAFILGDDASRYRLLGACINWDRVLVAFQGETALGYAAFKWQKKGPFCAERQHFVEHFGRLSGGVRFTLFQFFEQRELRYPFFLYGLRVNKHVRNQGVAGTLLEAACEYARQAGARHVDLEVQRHNRRARRLYLHHRFQVVRSSWLPPLKGWPALFSVQGMRRDLEPCT